MDTKEQKKRGPWLPQVEVSKESLRKLNALRKRWGYGGKPLTIAATVRRMIDECYEIDTKEKQGQT